MQPSIRRRILFLTTTTVVVVVAFVCVVVAWRTERVLRSDFDETLRALAVALASRLGDENGQIKFETELVAETSAPVWGNTAVLIVDRDGRVVFSSAGREVAAHVLKGSRPSAALNTPSWFDVGVPEQATKSRFVELSVQLEADSSDEKEPTSARQTPLGAAVYVGRSAAGLENAIVRLRWTLGGVLIAAAFAALVGGYFVASVGTREVNVVAERIAKVRPECPKLEIDTRRVPIELLPMIQTTQSLMLRIDEELVRQRRLTADVAHDLRTPLAGVRALLDVCLRRERSAPEYVETISQALAALRQTSTMMDNVLTLARLDADAEQPQFQRVDVSQVLANALEAVAPLSAERKIVVKQVSNEGRGDHVLDIRIDTDSAFLIKILVNLLSNAIEHSPVGGTVQITEDVQDSRVEIKVGDQGPGVRPELREQIFERFFRTDAARATVCGHNGLGLPISRGLARLLGGDVRLDQSGDSGSVFTIALPRIAGAGRTS